MTPETRKAWANCLYYAISLLYCIEPENPVSGASVLTPEELETLRVTFKEKSKNLNIAIKAFHKYNSKYFFKCLKQ